MAAKRATTDKPRGPAIDAEAPEKWNTLPKRLKWVVTNRRPAVTSLEDWSLKAGHSRQYLSSAIKRATETGGSLNLREAAGLVRVPGVNIDLFWLATGLGHPASGEKGVEDPWPKRVAAAHRAMDQGVAYETIDRVRQETNANPNEFRDKTEAFWYRRFLEEDLRRLRLVQAPPRLVDGAASDEDD